MEGRFWARRASGLGEGTAQMLRACWGPEWASLPACLPDPGHSRADEDCGDERARHREERLLGARLDRDQEKLLR